MTTMTQQSTVKTGTAPAPVPQKRQTLAIAPGSFEPGRHFYPKVLNAHVHPLVRFFYSLGNHRLAERFCHLHPEVDVAAVHALLKKQSRYFKWGGADLFHVTTEHGVRKTVVIETNSSPSGQKSMPLLDEAMEQGGYRRLLDRVFVPQLKRRGIPPGGLAVLYDKNLMEASGYAATLADLCGETVFLVPCFEKDHQNFVRFTEDGVLEICYEGSWEPIRGALRYVTQRPWNRIPAVTRTFMLNPVLACLSGGRNKMLAAKAYDLYNGQIQPAGLEIRIPETIGDVSRDEVPLWVRRMGGIAVIKVPYSNAGQGVFTITSEAELEAFMDNEQRYDRFIVQALIGNARWSSRSKDGRLYHIGTVPNQKSEIYVADVRCMIGSSAEGFFPVAFYARRARSPLVTELDGTPSWGMLGTNLSIKKGEDGWDTESERLLLMDSREFNRLGLGLDDLIECYIQTVLAVSAIDTMACGLVTARHRFRRRFFRTLNPDAALANEIYP